MVQQGLIDEAVFSFWLNKNEDSDNGGELYFGGANAEHYIGDINYVNLTSTTYWQFTTDSYYLINFYCWFLQNIIETGDISIVNKFTTFTFFPKGVGEWWSFEAKFSSYRWHWH